MATRRAVEHTNYRLNVRTNIDTATYDVSDTNANGTHEKGLAAMIPTPKSIEIL